MHSKRPCKRKISIDRTFERSNTEYQRFFNEILDCLEADFTLPDHRRDSILRELFPTIIYNKIVAAVPPIQVKDLFGLGKTSQTIRAKKNVSVATAYTFKSSSSEVLTESSDHVPTPEEIPIYLTSESMMEEPLRVWRQPIGDIHVIPMLHETEPKEEVISSVEEPEVISSISLGTKETPASRSFDSLLVKIMNHKVKPKFTLYYTFFKKTAENAALWRSLANALPELRTAEEKANLIAEQIANNFVDWVHENGLHESLTANEVINMFSPIKDWNKIIVRQEELFSVPGQVGWSLGLKERTTQFVLADQIVKDKRAFEFTGEKNVAFGKSLPHSLYKGTSINDSYKKWLKSKIPLRIETMESVFSEIEDLVITKKYANFIAARPYIRPPPYLLECGLITYPEGQSFMKSTKGRRRLTRRETIYTLCEGPKVERLRYSDVRLPILENENY